MTEHTFHLHSSLLVEIPILIWRGIIWRMDSFVTKPMEKKYHTSIYSSDVQMHAARKNAIGQYNIYLRVQQSAQHRKLAFQRVRTAQHWTFFSL